MKQKAIEKRRLKAWMVVGDGARAIYWSRKDIGSWATHPNSSAKVIRVTIEWEEAAEAIAGEVKP